MPLKNTNLTYGSVNKFFHWTIFILILLMIGVGFFMDDIGNKIAKGQVYNLHKLIGITILVLMILRLMWALMNKKPRLPDDISRFEKVMERVVHGLLYVTIIAMPISGWIMSSAEGRAPNFFGLFKMPLPVPQSKQLGELTGDIHFYLAWIIIGLVSLHVLAALKHHYFDKDNVLLRMMPGDQDK